MSKVEQDLHQVRQEECMWEIFVRHCMLTS